DCQGREPRGGASGERGAALPLYPGPGLSGALSKGLPTRAGGRRDCHLPHAWLRGGAGDGRPTDSLAAGSANRTPRGGGGRWSGGTFLRVLSGAERAFGQGL